MRQVQSRIISIRRPRMRCRHVFGEHCDCAIRFGRWRLAQKNLGAYPFSVMTQHAGRVPGLYLALKP